MMKHAAVTESIIAAFYHVYNELGFGFLERVYENALAHELQKRGLNVIVQRPIKVWYDGVEVGEYFADLLVEQCVIVELKSAAAIGPAHEAQLINYLKATGIEVGLILNFGPKAEVKRKVNTKPSDTNSYPRISQKSA